MLIRNESEEQNDHFKYLSWMSGYFKGEMGNFARYKNDGLLIESALSFTRSKSRELVQATSPRRKTTWTLLILV